MNGSTNSPGELKLHRLSDKHAKELVKIGNQVHLRSMRAAFTALMPFLLVAGLAVLLIAALSTILQGAALAQLHVWALALCKGTINVAGILIAPLAAYHLAQNKAFANPLAVALTASAALFIMLFASRTYPAISTKPGLFEQVGPSGV
ncbi:hypothetical protein EQ500_10455, partial [Lactobacillus sp. XV13L]|nr:hypothetical protein [Lactobacillus sp. XV13L]